MADSKDVVDKDQCNYCKKPVFKKMIKCLKCDKSYHNSCSSRVLCCEMNLNDQTSQTKHVKGEELSMNKEDDLISLTITNEKLIIENNNLKIENMKLKQVIEQLEGKTKKLPNENISYGNKLKEGESSTVHVDQNKEIQVLITHEVDKHFSIVLEDLRQLKLKMDKLERVNKVKQSPKKELAKKVNISHQTKTQPMINIPETLKQKSEQSVQNELEIKQRTLMNELINLNPSFPKNVSVSERQNIENQQTTKADSRMKENVQKDDYNRWTTINRRKYPKIDRPEPIKGTGVNSNELGFPLAQKQSWLFISGYGANAPPEIVSKYLREKINIECVCEKIKTRKDHFQSSFKVRIPSNNVADVLSPDLWPEGIMVNHFMSLRRRPTEWIEGVN